MQREHPRNTLAYHVMLAAVAITGTAKSSAIRPGDSTALCLARDWVPIPR